MRTKTPEWYDQKVKDIKKKKRQLTKAQIGDVYEGKILTSSKKKKQAKEDLTKEKRKHKRGEKQDAKRLIQEEVQNWKMSKK